MRNNISRNNKTDKKFKLISFISLIFGISAFGTFGYGMNKLDNYFHDILFSVLLCSIGLVCGLSFYYFILCNIFSDLKEYQNKGWNISVGFTIGFVGLIFGIGNYINIENSTLKISEEFEITNKTQGGGRQNENYLFVNINSKTERIICTTEYWNEVSIGQKIKLNIMKGCIGFDYIEIPKNKASI